MKEGQVMIVTEYHKSMAAKDQVKVILRFLPEASWETIGGILGRCTAIPAI